MWEKICGARKLVWTLRLLKKTKKNYISGKKHEKNVLKKWVKKLIVLRVR